MLSWAEVTSAEQREDYCMLWEGDWYWYDLLECCILWRSEALSKLSKMEDAGGFLTSVMGKRGWHLPTHRLFSNMSR